MTPFVRPSRRGRKDDGHAGLAEEVERLRRENEDLRAQLAAERAEVVVRAALAAAARVLAVVRGEAELRIAEARWALLKQQADADAAIARTNDELARLESLKRQLSHQTNAFAADLTALVQSRLEPAPSTEALDAALADRLRDS